ncbi:MULTISPECIES: hypothetical protein [unclassified Streptomyces]|uniref:hypothetical protein n=1 Tax=unclassified Streptomyces TaxID=2593676 RepID=UPI002DDC41F9|nr:MULTISPECIES: hypothetical protein [unclassified Streptomyces]WSA92084.1 hypothetical protein OIE63_11260 [Streptomyces sp. NBC_01795]WSB76449.1 hypothetical protein OHB04_12050 [Streptomyces sp. NBC_01775]WSS15275.1 hypothetical protein OG533_27865 [Streptomyces sp. NBC_01186]WSS44118.1 hypothetical protein OG220_28670 [Streptomyces sp. NBC_01187]
MLALRLTFSAPPLALLLRMLLLCSSAGVGLLLVTALGHALEHQAHPAPSVARLLWCLVPLAVTAQLSAALSRTEPRLDARTGLASAGLGPGGLPLLAALTAAVPCVAGSGVALLLVARRSGENGLTLPGALVDIPLPGLPLPVPATLTLLSAVPVVAAGAAAWAARPRGTGAATGAPDAASSDASTSEAPQERLDARGAPVRTGLLWGTALTASGLLLAAFSASRLPGRTPSSPGSTERPVRAEDLVASPLPAGWTLAAVGLVLAGPGLVALGGRLLALGLPGPVRLLAGRALVREAPYVGRPLGGLGVTAAALVAFARIRGTGGGAAARLPGPLVGLAVALMACCVAGTVLAALARARHTRLPASRVLDRLGAPRRVRRRVTLSRMAVLTAVFVLLVWGAGLLAALPLS